MTRLNYLFQDLPQRCRNVSVHIDMGVNFNSWQLNSWYWSVRINIFYYDIVVSAALQILVALPFLGKEYVSWNLKKNNYYLWLLPFFCLLFPFSVQAEETTLNIYATPIFPDSQVDEGKGYYDLNLAPNQKETLRLEIGNTSAEPIRIQVTPHTAYTNVLGNVEYGKNAQEADPTLVHSLADLMESSEVIELAGNETKTVEIPLQMPEEAFEGFLAGGLRIAEQKRKRQKPTKQKEKA